MAGITDIMTCRAANRTLSPVSTLITPDNFSLFTIYESQPANHAVFGLMSSHMSSVALLYEGWCVARLRIEP